MRNKIILGIILVANLSFSYTPNSIREINKIKNEKVEVFREKFEDTKTNRSLLNIKFDFKNGDFYEKTIVKDENSGFRIEKIKIKRKIYQFRTYSFKNNYVGVRVIGYEDNKENVLYKHWVSSNDSKGYESKIKKEMTAKHYYENGLTEVFLLTPHSENKDKELSWVDFDSHSYHYRRMYEKLMSELEKRNKEVNLEKLEIEVLKKPSLTKLKSETNSSN